MRHGEVKMRSDQGRMGSGHVRQGITSCEAVRSGENGVKGRSCEAG